MTRWLGINEGVRDKCPWHLMRLQERRTLDLASRGGGSFKARQGKARKGRKARQVANPAPRCRATGHPLTPAAALPVRALCARWLKHEGFATSSVFRIFGVLVHVNDERKGTAKARCGWLCGPISARASSVRRVQLQTLHRYSFRKVARLHAAPADATGLDQQLQQQLILWNVWQDCVDSQENHFWHGQKHVATTIHQ